jgi:hypothetical protein
MLIFIIVHNVFGLGEGGGFTVELDTKHTLQIYEKLSYEALNRHFCQTRVMRSCYHTIVQFFNPIQSKVPIAIAVYVRCNF